MGMVWQMRVVDRARLAEFRSDPSELADFVYGEDIDPSEDGRNGETHEIDSPFDCDKQWHVLHYLLTGSADATESALSIILGPFEEIGEDVGYGPAWVIPSDRIAAAHLALDNLTDADLRARYDPAGMVRADVYLGQTLADEGTEGLDFIMEDVTRLRVFLRAAAASSLDALGCIG